MKILIKENLAKNILAIALLVILYFPISGYLMNSNLFVDISLAGNVLVATSIIAVTACFGNFAFTYEKIDKGSAFSRHLAHFTTGLLMLIIGVSLIFTSILATFVMGHFVLIDLLLIALYVACVGYDFWDLFRVL